MMVNIVTKTTTPARSGHTLRTKKLSPGLRSPNPESDPEPITYNKRKHFKTAKSLFPKKQTSNRHVSHEATNFPAPVRSENTLKTVISKN